MKFEYFSPVISVEVLDNIDVLLSSTVVPTPTTPSKKELENAYRDIADFIGSGDWFD